MVQFVQTSLPYGILASHILLVFLLLALVFRNSWGKEITDFVGKYAINFGFLVSLVAISGSLFYSDIVHFEPCVLCWWQRVLLYPQVIIFAVALWHKKKDVFLYVIPMVSMAAMLGAYQAYVYMGGTSILPCTALGGACAKNYVLEFGYISIPMASLTISLYILLLAWTHRIYDKNRNAR